MFGITIALRKRPADWIDLRKSGRVRADAGEVMGCVEWTTFSELARESPNDKQNKISVFAPVLRQGSGGITKRRPYPDSCSRKPLNDADGR